MEISFVKWEKNAECVFASPLHITTISSRAYQKREYQYNIPKATSCIYNLKNNDAANKLDFSLIKLIKVNQNGCKEIASVIYPKNEETKEGANFLALYANINELWLDTYQFPVSGFEKGSGIIPEFEFNYHGFPGISDHKYSLPVNGLSALGLSFETIIEDIFQKVANFKKSGICAIRFFDSENIELFPDMDLSYSEKHGYFFYLNPSGKGTKIMKLWALDPDCARVDIQFEVLSPPLPIQFKRTPRIMLFTEDNLIGELLEQFHINFL